MISYHSIYVATLGWVLLVLTNFNDFVCLRLAQLNFKKLIHIIKNLKFKFKLLYSVTIPVLMMVPYHSVDDGTILFYTLCQLAVSCHSVDSGTMA